VTEAETPTGRDLRSLVQRYWWVIGLLSAVLVVVILAPLASSDPDGLERVAEDKAFIDTAKESRYEWLPDYSIPGLEGDLSTVLAGLVGIAIVFTAVVFYGRLVAARRP
jgi:hypothetical protein